MHENNYLQNIYDDKLLQSNLLKNLRVCLIIHNLDASNEVLEKSMCKIR